MSKNKVNYESMTKDQLISKIEQLNFELIMVSKLAADEPMFISPLNAAHAAIIRDKVLKVNHEK